MPKYNERKLSYSYSKKQKDFLVRYPRSCDGALICNLFSDILRFDVIKQANYEHYPFNVTNIQNELEKRGYDLSTLKFSIELLPNKE